MSVDDAKRELVNEIHSAIGQGFDGQHAAVCQHACDEAIDALIQSVRDDEAKRYICDLADADATANASLLREEMEHALKRAERAIHDSPVKTTPL